MSPEAQSVLNFILENPGMKNRTIAREMNIPMGTVNAIVVKLRKDGHVKPAVTDPESTFYGQCWPVEPTPIPTQGSSVDTGEAEGGGDGTAAPGSPTPTPEVQAALEAAKELAEENARLRLRLSHIRAHRNELESELFHISWLCEAAGFTGSGDTVDQLCWLLDHLGHPNFARAIPARRSALRKIQEGEEELRGLQMQVRLDLPRETDDRCRCGREATKVEGEEGFTQCDPCFHREGGE
jgi:Winged helix-turn-helix DNA-binding